jgi:LmbE family N-acetylglucosaminyl deacetylase
MPRLHWRRYLGLWAGTVSFGFASASASAAEASPSPAAILQDLKSFSTLGSVLHVAAHPDDENTQLITYLARGRGYRAAYLSVTRGDGGQNELGPEFGEKLGLARTQELLAARRLDGGQQFFTRALDFGYTKSVDETLGLWDRQQLVGDVVRVIRTFRPDVIVTRFAPVPQPGNHGQHNTSAVLALEAFKLAGDPKAFPEQLKELTVWQPKRILLNGSGPGRGGNASAAAPAAPPTGTVRMEMGGNDPVTGESFGSIAGRSRAMHKTQGFGNFGAGGGGSRVESFTLIDGEPATNDIMDGIDLTWARFPNGAEIARLTDAAIAAFNSADPAANVPALLAIRSRVAALPADRVIDEKRRQLDRILTHCLGLAVETTLPQAEVVPGESLALSHTATVASKVPVRWTGLRYPSKSDEIKFSTAFTAGQAVRREQKTILPATTVPTQPYWLRLEGTAGMFRVDNPSLIGRPENPPAFPVEFVFEVGGQTLIVADEPVQIVAGAPEAQARRHLEVIPPVSLSFGVEVELFAPGASKTATVEVTAARAGATGTIHLETPAGWKISPATQPFKLAAIGDKARLIFTVNAPAEKTSASLRAVADINGAHFDNSRSLIRYEHLPVQLLQPPTRLKVVALDLSIRGRTVGYLPGAGDSVAENLTQMGYAVTELTGADLTPANLKRFDAVVIGVRAFNERTDLKDNFPGLLAYVEAGGTVIAQYNRPNALKTQQLGPYKLSIQGNAPAFRVTDEKSPVSFLSPDHRALNAPNHIAPSDFDGWVQERGAYFPSSWDEEHYTPLFAMNDPGEAPLQGSVLVAKYGKGHYVYTGLGFFRQLPAGVPGAYRLFANLLSLGQE